MRLAGVIFVLAILELLIIVNEVESQSCTPTNKNGVEETLPTATYVPEVFSSPGFDSDSYYPIMDCRWLFDSGDANAQVVLDITYYDIENGPSCSYDSLTFYDGNSASGEPYIILCSLSRSGRLLITSGRYGLLKLKSDFSVQKAGFNLQYLLGEPAAYSDCTSTLILTGNSTAQFITNPDFPTAYDKAQTCSYRIDASPSHYGVQINLRFSDLMGGEECYSDLLEIYDGTDDTGNLMVTICDDRTIRRSGWLGSSGHNLFIKFSTRLSGRSRTGFVLEYRSYDNGVSTTSIATTTIRTSSTCSSNVVNLAATSEPGILQSPDYPEFYTINLDCKWLISAAVGEVIQLTVLGSNLHVVEGCFGDSVYIYDGQSSSYPLLTTFCGTAASNATSTSNKMYVHFRSDSSVGQRGFQVQYVSVSGTIPDCVDNGNSSGIQLTVLNATRTPQYFTSPNYPSDYNSSETHHWLIHNPTDSGVIYLQTVDSRLEASVGCIYDSVTIYKGPCTNYPQLSKFCGTETPTVQQNVGTYVLVIFVADGRSQYKGFRMKYYVGDAEEEGLSMAEKIGIIVGSVLGSLVLVGLIAALVYGYKKGKLPGMESEKSKQRRGSVSSMSSSSSSSSSNSSVVNERSTTGPPGRLAPLKGGQLKTPPSIELYSKKVLLPAIKK